MENTKFILPDLGYKDHFTNPENYLMSEELFHAVQVALILGQPLLLTGDPGTGKTRLAHKIAFTLAQQNPGEYHRDPFIFNTKSTTVYTDLFYHYDAVRHFHDASIAKASNQQSPQASSYVSLKGLGKAIAMSHPNTCKLVGSEQPMSSVLLIDEIDKAPRDFPNDLLNEIENYQFDIAETNQSFAKGDHRIVIIMTSNTEKSLPDAFLRRCSFYHITFPDKPLLMQIVSARMSNLISKSENQVGQALDHFLAIREQVSKKPPATAELLAWLKILEVKDFFNNGLDFNQLSQSQKQTLQHSYSVLIKNKEDFDEIINWLNPDNK